MNDLVQALRRVRRPADDKLPGVELLCSAAADRIEALAAELVEHQWRPIETAPKEEWGLLGSPLWKRVVYARWISGQWQDHNPGGAYLKYVDLWMPLPKPPVTP